MTDRRLLVLIRGALMPPPRIEEPAMKIPLEEAENWNLLSYRGKRRG
jgi:hypothetical protein